MISNYLNIDFYLFFLLFDKLRLKYFFYYCTSCNYLKTYNNFICSFIIADTVRMNVIVYYLLIYKYYYLYTCVRIVNLTMTIVTLTMYTVVYFHCQQFGKYFKIY